MKVLEDRIQVTWRKMAVMLLCLLLASCATHQVPSNSNEKLVNAESVLNTSPLAKLGGSGETKNTDTIDILDVSPEMRDFLAANINRNTGQRSRLDQLVDAVVSGDRFVLAYDDSTRTAWETFAKQRGNCLSFTSMFVAMAREIGLKARYQEVEIPPDWSMSGEVFLLSRHVNALIELQPGITRVVDFNTFNYHIQNEGHSITDDRARAHYFNNIGVEHMLSGANAGAYANFSRSLENDERFAPAWVNMGILHRREGLDDYAEAAYLRALELDRYDLLAMSNLANLYDEQGDVERSERYLAEVRSHRMKNPYYRYEAANEAFGEGDYETAISHLKYAIRKRDKEDRFYYLLSLSYLMTGDRERAVKWMEKAEAVAEENKDRERYNHKLELLTRQNSISVSPDQSPNASLTAVE